MSICHLKIGALSFFCIFLLCGCGISLSSIEKENDITFRVNNPDASYFDVHERKEMLSKTDSKVLRIAKRTPLQHCEGIPEPVGYLRMPRFDRDRAGWHIANEPLKRFENYITMLSESYITTSDDKFALCLANALNKWAEHGALLQFKYTSENRQAWFAVEWATTSAGMAYSIIRDNPTVDPKIKQNIEDWLKRVAKNQIRYKGGRLSSRNNHAYWRGLQATIVGVVTDDDSLFRFGISKYVQAINAISKRGDFPLEMLRGDRALHYQNFAILPLVYIAEIASRQGYDLYSINNNGRDLHFAIDFLMKHIDDHDLIDDRFGYQDLTFVYRKSEMNWMEPYFKRFGDVVVGSFLEKRRPIYNRWSGGSSTLYYYEPLLEE